MNTIQEIRETAEAYYVGGELFCSEAVLKSVLEGVGYTPSHESLSMASGFPVGIGGAGCTCGALSGGIMAIGYAFGRSEPKGDGVKKTMSLSKELHDIFKTRNKCTCCRVLTHGFEKGSSEHKKQCLRFVGEMAEEAARIILTHK